MNNISIYLFITLTVILVHTIKFIRLYLAFYGTGMKWKEALRTFCIATPVSMIVPAKLGEIFRVLAYGRRIKSYFRGLIIILLDRFVDTMALLMIMLLIFAFTGSHMTAIAYFFLIFLVLVSWVYLAFPHIYKIWKRSLLLSKATEHKLELLALLDKIHKIYLEIEHIVKGRGVILFFLSLLAWGIEIGGIGSLVFFTGGSTSGMIGQYLSAAMMGQPSIWLSRVILVSVCLLLALYAVLLVEKMIRGKEEQA